MSRQSMFCSGSKPIAKVLLSIQDKKFTFQEMKLQLVQRKDSDFRNAKNLKREICISEPEIVTFYPGRKFRGWDDQTKRIEIGAGGSGHQGAAYPGDSA
jgi:hypothetical protein